LFFFGGGDARLPPRLHPRLRSAAESGTDADGATRTVGRKARIRISCCPNLIGQRAVNYAGDASVVEVTRDAAVAEA